MKSVLKKSLMAVVMAVTIVTTCILGGISASTAKSSLAADLPDMSNLEFTTDVPAGKKLAKGSSFWLYLTFTSKYVDTYWAVFDICVGPLNADKTAFDLDSAKKLTVGRLSEYIDFGDLDMEYDYRSMGTSNFLSKADTITQQGGCFRLVVTSTQDPESIPTDADKSVTFGIKFDVAADIEADELTMGVVKLGSKPTPSNSVGFGETTELNHIVKGEKTKGMLTTNDVTIQLVDEEDDTSISELLIGPEADPDKMKAADLTTTPNKFVFDEFMEHMYVKPTLATGATCVADLLPDGGDETTFTPTTAIASEEIKEITVPHGNSKIVIIVTSASGETERHIIEITMSYVRLGDLEVTVGDGSITTLGLQETFDKDTFAYTVNVPDETDGASAKITATVLAGFGISETLALTATDCSVVSTSATSGTEFELSAIKNDATLVITATAADATTTQDYTLTFAALSTDVNVTITASGAVKNDYTSDTEKATENSVDYYFYLTEESVFEAALNITVADGAAVTITPDGGSAITYDDSTKANKYELGTYTVTVTAVAGNTKDYLVILAAPELIELTLDSDYLFLFEAYDDSLGLFMRRAYIEYDFVHGTDDKDWTCHIVLGNVPYLTTVNELLKNIKDTLHQFIKISSDFGTVYDCGNPGEGYTEDMFDNVMYAVGTGWRVDLCPDGTNPVDTVYISILTDLNGDGQVTGGDLSVTSSYMSARVDLDGTEYRLAGYVSNAGYIGGPDLSAMSSIMSARTELSDYVDYVEHSRVSERDSVVVYMGASS